MHPKFSAWFIIKAGRLVMKHSNFEELENYYRNVPLGGGGGGLGVGWIGEKREICLYLEP
jgi:hypothetical protein